VAHAWHDCFVDPEVAGVEPFHTVSAGASPCSNAPVFQRACGMAT
jgi:hypothetical protein